MVKVPEVEEKIGSFIIARSSRDEKLAKAAQMEGIIVALGQTAWTHPTLGGEPWAEVDDTVYFSKFGGTQIEDPETGKDYVMINDEDVFAIVKKGNVDE